MLSGGIDSAPVRSAIRRLGGNMRALGRPLRWSWPDRITKLVIEEAIASLAIAVVDTEGGSMPPSFFLQSESVFSDSAQATLPLLLITRLNLPEGIQRVLICYARHQRLTSLQRRRGRDNNTNKHRQLHG